MKTLKYKNPKRIIKSYLKDKDKYFYFEVDDILYKIKRSNFSIKDKIHHFFTGDEFFIKLSLFNLKDKLKSFHLLSDYIQVESNWELYYNKYINSKEYEFDKSIEDTLKSKKIEVKIDYSKYPVNGLCNTHIVIENYKITFVVDQGLRLNSYDLEYLYLILYKKLLELEPSTKNLKQSINIDFLDFNNLNQEYKNYIISYFKSRNLLTKFKTIHKDHIGFVSSVVQIPEIVLKEIFKD